MNKQGGNNAFDATLVPLEEVNKDNLAYDMEDMRRVKVGGFQGLDEVKKLEYI